MHSATVGALEHASTSRLDVFDFLGRVRTQDQTVGCSRANHDLVFDSNRETVEPLWKVGQRGNVESRLDSLRQRTIRSIPCVMKWSKGATRTMTMPGFSLFRDAYLSAWMIASERRDTVNLPFVASKAHRVV